MKSKVEDEVQVSKLNLTGVIRHHVNFNEQFPKIEIEPTTHKRKYHRENTFCIMVLWLRGHLNVPMDNFQSFS